MTTVRVLAGDDPDALLERVFIEYVAALRAGRERQQADVAVWLTPTKYSQRAVTSRLVKEFGHACWMPRVTTFEGFAEWLLRRAGRPATPISSTRRRLLLRRITRELSAAGQLVHFASVTHTGGFLDVVESFIAELKRDEIWPEHFLEACAGISEVTQRDRELGRVYQRYQDVLLARKWYDAEGRFWLARTELESGRCEPLPAWSYIAAVGFSDFTRTQHEILEQLARRTEQLSITLPWDESRPELFAKPISTWERLAKSFPNVRRDLIFELRNRRRGSVAVSRFDETQSSREPAFRRAIREGLFSNPREWTPSESAEGLQIVAATGPYSERAAVARRIKLLLADGLSAGSIAVGLRSLTTDGRAWTQSLRDAGLPVWCEIGPPLKEQGLVKILVAVLQAELHDWEFPRLMTVLDSSFFRPAWKDDVSVAVRAVSAVLRRMQLPERKHVILEALERVAARNKKEDPGTAIPGLLRTEDAHDAPLDDLARRALPLLRWYSSHTEPLRRTHTLSEWIDVLAELVTRFNAAADGSSDAGVQDASLWELLQRTLRDAAEAEIQARETPRRMDLAEFLEEFRDLMADERVDPAAEHPGCVRVLSLDQLRHVAVKYLFVAGLTEDSFPRRRGDDCLFTDAERERLASRGLSLLHQQRHQQEEMLFFHSLLLRAERGLTITYSEIDVHGQPVFASPYLSAIRALFAAAALPVQREGQLDPVPPANAALSGDDLRLVAMEAALSGKAGWLRTLAEASDTRPMVQNLLAAVEMTRQRFHVSGFTCYEGRLDHPVNLRSLAERFGPQRQFSATELEEYAICPFRFWLKRVLELEPLAEPTEGTDHLGRGNIVHDVLAELLPSMTAGAAPQELADRFRELVGERLDRQPTSTELQRALTRIERRLLDDWAAAYAVQVEKYSGQLRAAWETGWTAAPPELAFGDVPGEPDPQRPAYPALELGGGERRVLLRGKIDRIDFGNAEGLPVYTVIDYKTGKRPRFSAEELESGRALQLALYTLAAQRLGISPVDAAPFQLGYWCLKETGFTPGLGKRGDKLPPLDAAVWQSLVQILEETAPRLAAGIRHGEFVVANEDKDCTSHCDFRTVCRINQVRPMAEVLVKLRRDFRTAEATP